MNQDEALSRMIPPGGSRPWVPWRGGVLQIWVTRACDKACFSCTQGSNLAGRPGMITVEQFERACISLRDYWGVVGVFGGNPAMHPQFETLCEILAKYVPREQRGLWCNNPLGKGPIMRKTFNPAYSNLNVHLDQKAFDEFRRDWPESKPFGLDRDSRHSPPYVAMQDVVEDEAERWSLIANCDINREWSAMICVFRGQLRGYFCEIAGSQAMLHQNESDYPDLGVEVIPDWWKRPMADFAAQVKYHCHACGVPLRGYGQLSQSSNSAELASKTHADIYKPKTKGRPLQLVTDRKQIQEQSLAKMTDYLGNSKRDASHIPDIRVAVVTPYYRESPDVLRTCMESVARQSVHCMHILVADGHPQDVATNERVQHLILPKSHSDNGNTARAVGSALALGEGYDAIAFLDADNWYYPNHLAAMIETHRSTGASICTATRSIHRLDGSAMFVDKGDSDGVNHVDTSCLFITRAAFSSLYLWAMMPRELSPICDRVFFSFIKSQRFARAHCAEPTIGFRSQYAVHYTSMGESPPANAKSGFDSAETALRWWSSLSENTKTFWAGLLGYRPEAK